MTTGITPASTDSLRALKGEYDRLLSERPGDERLLEILITMEEEVRSAALEIFKGAPEESSAASQLQQLSVQYVHAAPRESMKILDRLTGALEPSLTEGIDGLLAQVWERLQVLLTASNDYREVIRGLNMLHHVRAGVILPPDDWSREISEGPGNGDWAERAASYPKLNQLLELLREHGVYADDVLVVSGTLREGQMRQESYLYLEIPRLSRTVLICNAYGEASFVYQGLMQRERVFEETKSQMQERYGKKLIRILYTSEDLGEWRQKMVEALFFTRIETVEGGDGTSPEDGGGEQVCPNPVGRKVDVREREEVIAGILEVCPTPEEWMGMTSQQKKQLKIVKMGLTAIASIFGVEGDPRTNSSDMAELGRKIYGNDHEIIECEFWNPGRWIVEVRKHFSTPEQWMGMTSQQKIQLKIVKKGLTVIASIFGVEGDPRTNSSDMAELGRKIYGNDHEIIECEFWNPGRWIVEVRKHFSTPEQWMGMIRKEKLKVKLDGIGLRALSTLVGIESGNPAGNSSDMAKMGRVIYGEGHDIIECEFWDRDKWIEEIKKKVSTPEEWMGMTSQQKKQLKIVKKGLNSIARIFGVEGDPSGNSSDMAELGREIYGSDHEIIECEFWSADQWKEKIKEQYRTPEIWMGMTSRQKQQLKIFDKGLVAISRIFGVEGNPIRYYTVMAQLGRMIYGDHSVFEKFLREEGA